MLQMFEHWNLLVIKWCEWFE